MDDTFKNKLKAIYHILERESAEDIIVMNMKKTCSWTDYLIVATALNSIHLNHLAKLVREYLNLVNHNENDEKWCMIDSGEIVISLMESQTRQFYSLEDLWYESELMDIF